MMITRRMTMKGHLRTRVGIGVAWALVAMACGKPAPLSSPTLLPIEAGGSVASTARPDLIGSWQLVSLTESGQGPLTVAEPERFTVEFTPDGRAALRADCNRCSGHYEAKGNFLAVGVMACTRAYCASAPLDSKFVAAIGQATAWTSIEGGLDLLLLSEAGVLRLRERPSAN
jgi:heat shock protein HslJ